MKNVYIKNTLTLSVCMLISKAIGALYRIPLSNILGTEGIGLYQMVFPVYSLFLVFITGGMPVYLAQRISKYRAIGDNTQIYTIVKNAMFLVLTIAIMFCLLIISISKPISVIQGNSNAYLGYVTVSVSIIFSACSAVYKGYFQGHEDMTPSAFGGIIEQLAKLFLGLGLTYILKPFGTLFAVSGAFLGVLASEIACFVYLLCSFVKNRNKHDYSKIKYSKKEAKNIFLEFLPVSLSNLVLPISSCVDTFLIVNLLISSGFALKQATSLFGIATGMVNPLVNFPVILCGTLATAMLPAITYLISQKKDISSIVQNTYFFVIFISLPCVFGIVALAPNIIDICFPAIEYLYKNVTVNYLRISALNIVFLSLATLSTSVLNSYSKFKLPLFVQIVSFFVKFLVLIPCIVVPKINILALAIATVVSNLIYCVTNIYFVKKSSRIFVDRKKILIALINSLLMFILIFYLNNILIFNKMLKTFILVGFGIIFYLFLSFLFKLISIKQIKQLIFNKQQN